MVMAARVVMAMVMVMDSFGVIVGWYYNCREQIKGLDLSVGFENGSQIQSTKTISESFS